MKIRGRGSGYNATIKAFSIQKPHLDILCPLFNWQYLDTIELANIQMIEIELCEHAAYVMKRGWCDNNVKSSTGTFVWYILSCEGEKVSANAQVEGIAYS